MSIEREIGKGLSFIDDTVRDITRRTMSQGSVKNFDIFLTTPIENYCLIDMADFQLQRHMLMNLMQKDNLIYLMGNNVSGISNKVSDETYYYDYSYTQGNNYLEDYQRYDAKETTTRTGWRNDNIQNYVNHNQVYGETINVYPDDDDTGTHRFIESEKWDSYLPNRNPNSIIKKTKDFFRCRKINTIISRFHTDAEKLDLYDNTESATSAYGLSHGRNLLTYDAERNGISYDRNGYDNPYCRVWTHHHQYSQHRNRLIRPFTVEGEDGENTITNQSLHKWDNFPNTKYISREGYSYSQKTSESEKEFTFNGVNQLDNIVIVGNKYEKWGWKDKGADGWAMSVLDKETGLVNIAPKYLGGAEKNIHPKDCMFSIENLAWQGYDPYSFERALSWEQRGPFGGRIMWFPPYGLRFNEDTSVQWNEHSFIGRGESVYTYTNTSRSGTLEFMMVVDHPSILDYATWYGKSQPDQLPKDTDVLRFFAGCDSGNSNDESSLLSYVKPTPLTDEYLQKDVTPGPIPIESEEPTPPEPEVESPDEPIELSFYVFYPNNYSGTFDRKSDSKVDPIAYLLCGNGAQWKCNTNNVKQSEVLPISFNDLSTTDEQFLGKGYEMQASGSNVGKQNDDKNYIIGTGPTKGYGKNTYIQNNDKKWYYRIDGEYVNGITYNAIKNCFGQTLTRPNSYQDTQTCFLNCNIDEVKKSMQEENNDNLYTLAEVACALTSDVNANVIKTNAGSLSDERINKLKEYFNKEGDYKVIEIKGVGYSNAHNSRTNKVKYDYGDGNGPVLTPLRDARNDFLAKERCTTAIEWFKSLYGYVKISEKKHEKNKAVGNEDESGKTAKMWRSAKITLKIKKNKVEKQEELNTKNDGTTVSSIDYEKLSNEDKNKYEFSQYKIKEDTPPYATYIDVKEYNDLALSKPEIADKYIVCGYKLKEEFKDEKVKIENNKFERFDGFEESGKGTVNGKEVPLYINKKEEREKFKNKKWYYDEEEKQMKFYDKVYEKTRRSSYGWTSEYGNDFKQKEENNTLRYDQEYHFFKKLSERDPDVFSSLVDKLQYFDPAFHSMTPEGFMGRLNFLHQCTRQGDTRSASDENGHTANNLAFGRPPFCVLRLGDFYYQKIVIRNINISYDPLVLDLNQEGVGVVPLIANVTISFNFIGGGDLSGPVRRLQNAMSENYYANGRLYNNRADRIERNIEWDTMKTSINWDTEKTYHHHVKMSE